LYHRTNCLLHFTKDYGALLAILGDGFRPRYSCENIEWLEFAGDSKIGFPMVCFCDIPLSLNETHIRYFGSYGIGMSRRWAIDNDINPVRYVQTGSAVAKQLKSLHVTDKETMRALASTTQDIRFVDECEWRFVPKSKPNSHIPQYIVDHSLDSPDRLMLWNNRLEESAMLSFDTIDIECLIVKNECDIPQLQNDIAKLYAGKEQKELVRLCGSIKSIERSRLEFVFV